MLFHRRQDAQIALDTSRVVIANILLDHLDELVLAGESAFHHKLVQAGMTQSMSRVAHCIDNGPMEGFWGILKRERYYGSTGGVLETLCRCGAADARPAQPAQPYQKS